MTEIKKIYTCRNSMGNYIKEYNDMAEAINYAIKDDNVFYVEYEKIDELNGECYFSETVRERNTRYKVVYYNKNNKDIMTIFIDSMNDDTKDNYYRLKEIILNRKPLEAFSYTYQKIELC